MIKKLDETFDGLDPEINSMIAFQEKINELIHEINRIKKLIEPTFH